MPLSGHFLDIEGRVLVYQAEDYQLTHESAWMLCCCFNDETALSDQDKQYTLEESDQKSDITSS